LCLLKFVYAGESTLAVIAGAAGYGIFAALFAFVAFWYSPRIRVEA